VAVETFQWGVSDGKAALMSYTLDSPLMRGD
jgi:hypothetical protein